MKVMLLAAVMLLLSFLVWMTSHAQTPALPTPPPVFGNVSCDATSISFTYKQMDCPIVSKTTSKLDKKTGLRTVTLTCED